MTATTRTHGPTRRRVRAAALLGVLAVLLTGCVAIPTSGPVGVGVENVSDQGSIELLGDPPPQDGSPEDIVRGFLGAGAAGFNRSAEADSGDDFRIAREYLSGEVRRSWNPRERVVVYATASSPTVTPTSASQVEVEVRVTARIDADGRYWAAGTDAEETLSFELVQDDDGQWRISGLENGVVLSEPAFEAIYRTATLYFVSLDGTFLVPETRWFPLRNLATSIVRELIAGPSDWLRDAVRTAIPEGAVLQPDAVSVDDDGVAAVSLAAGGLPSEMDDRRLMQAQLEASLRIARVRTVEVSADGVALGTEAADLQRGQDGGGALEMIQGDTLVDLEQSELVPVEGIASLAGLDPHDPARDGTGSVRVMLSGTDTLMTVPTTGSPARTLLSASALVAPSVDRLGWAWTASRDVDGALLAVSAEDGTRIDVEGDWLDGRSIRSLRVARDATRVAVVSAGPDGVRVDLAAIIRDASGTPQAIGEPWRTAVTLVEATRVVWVDESTLGVLGRTASGTTPVLHLAQVAGQSQARPAIVDLVDIAAGKGEGTLYVVTAQGTLYGRSGSSWAQVVSDVRDPSFPG